MTQNPSAEGRQQLAALATNRLSPGPSIKIEAK